MMAKAGPITFFKQVRIEARKITWPSRQETMVSTIAVFIMVFFASLFLYFADQIIAYVVRLIVGLGL
ncbi:MAG: preprotein translocase subunit SecE [Alphaproteobacteria bacterium]|nr:preprotein translocase subunit SecE [Alphaproteobacteria bacterium]